MEVERLKDNAVCVKFDELTRAEYIQVFAAMLRVSKEIDKEIFRFEAESLDDGQTFKILFYSGDEFARYLLSKERPLLNG